MDTHGEIFINTFLCIERLMQAISYEKVIISAPL
jgi:hypothetical protein